MNVKFLQLQESLIFGVQYNCPGHKSVRSNLHTVQEEKKLNKKLNKIAEEEKSSLLNVFLLEQGVSPRKLSFLKIKETFH